MDMEERKKAASKDSTTIHDSLENVEHWGHVALLFCKLMQAIHDASVHEDYI